MVNTRKINQLHERITYAEERCTDCKRSAREYLMNLDRTDTNTLLNDLHAVRYFLNMATDYAMRITKWRSKVAELTNH